MLRSIFWWLVRIGTLLAGCYTINRVIISEGYRADYWNIVIVGVVVIVVNRIFMPRCKD
jgi:hypothetical protein